MIVNILTDIDEVWLNWIDGFKKWVSDNKGVGDPGIMIDWCLKDHYDISEEELESWLDEFKNCNDYVEPYEGSERCLRTLSSFFDIIGITAMDPVRESYVLNKLPYFKNIYFERDKEKVLKKYPRSIWIEDNIENALIGYNHGHYTFLMDRDHNKYYSEAVEVSEWKVFKSIVRIRSYEDMIKAIKLVMEYEHRYDETYE